MNSDRSADYIGHMLEAAQMLTVILKAWKKQIF